MNTSSFHTRRAGRDTAISRRLAVRTSGFTLIELLVVIAIIAILAAILFPVFAQARAKARQATCQSNLKQIGIAFLQYEQDFDEMTPIVVNYSGNYTGFISDWDLQIKPYIGVKVAYNAPTTVFQCPQDLAKRYTGTARSYSMVRGRGLGVAPYASLVNGAVIDPGRLISTIPDVSGTFLLAEDPNTNNVFGTDTTCIVDGPYYSASATSSQDNSGTSPAYHNNGWDYLYCDGHVKWLRPEQTLGNGTTGAPLGPWTIAAND